MNTGRILCTFSPFPTYFKKPLSDSYTFLTSPIAVWRSILLTILALNIFIVSLYGESEFWFASVKILAILGLIILGIVLFFGGGPNNDLLGFRYWQHPGAFTSYPNPGLGTTGKVLAFWTSLIRSGFAFVLGPELITLLPGRARRRDEISRKRVGGLYIVWWYSIFAARWSFLSSSRPMIRNCCRQSAKAPKMLVLALSCWVSSAPVSRVWIMSSTL